MGIATIPDPTLLDLAVYRRRRREIFPCACYRERYGSGTCEAHRALEERRQAALDAIDYRDVHGWPGESD